MRFASWHDAIDINSRTCREQSSLSTSDLSGHRGPRLRPWLHSLVCSLAHFAHSPAHGTVNDWMAILSVFFFLFPTLVKQWIPSKQQKSFSCSDKESQRWTNGSSKALLLSNSIVTNEKTSRLPHYGGQKQPKIY